MGDVEFRFEVWNRAAFSGFAIRCRRGEKDGGGLCSERRFQRRLGRPFQDERNHRASWSFWRISEGKGIPHWEYGRDEGTRLQLGTRRLPWILEQTRKKRRESRMANESFRIPRGILRPCRFAPFSLSLSPFPPSRHPANATQSPISRMWK